MEEHVHDWQPLNHFGARYRCTGCQSFGLKERLVNGGAKGSEHIRPYACYSCGAWAVTKEAGPTGLGTKKWRCARHRHQTPG